MTDAKNILRLSPSGSFILREVNRLGPLRFLRCQHMIRLGIADFCWHPLNPCCSQRFELSCTHTLTARSGGVPTRFGSNVGCHYGGSSIG
jgi:hypothetical protein